MFDTIIIGSGPAGLSAALFLGRSRHRVLLLNRDQFRNAAAEHVHNFLTRDGIPPSELRQIGRAQLEAYPSVETLDVAANDVHRVNGRFEIELADGQWVASRTVLLATGMRDHPPDLPGMAALWGKQIWQCPFCHGWEVRDRPLAVLYTEPTSLHHARLIPLWSDEVTFLTNGTADLPADQLEQLTAAGMTVDQRPVQGLSEQGNGIRVAFDDQAESVFGGMFLVPVQSQATTIPEHLGCRFTDHGFVQVDMMGRTSVAGVYAAGDLIRRNQAAIVAATDGMMAASSIIADLVFGPPAAPHE